MPDATPTQLDAILAIHRLDPRKAPLPRVTPTTEQADRWLERNNHIARNALGGCGVMERMAANDPETCGFRRCTSCSRNPARHPEGGMQ